MGENFVIQVSTLGLLISSILIHLQWQKHQLKKEAIKIKSKDVKK